MGSPFRRKRVAKLAIKPPLPQFRPPTMPDPRAEIERFIAQRGVTKLPEGVSARAEIRRRL